MGVNQIVIPYTPREQQLLIHDATQNARFVVVVAHRRFGKTVAAINEAICAATHTPEVIAGYQAMQSEENAAG